MASERKVNQSESAIMRIVSEIIRTEVKNSELGPVTIVDCRLTADLGLAKLYVSFLGGDRESSLAALNDSKGFIRHRLAGRLTTRKVPSLEFIIDDTLDKAEKLESILKNITK